MRIHSLTISAFGPFPGTHIIDFEELNDAGVFLVTGPTGAGKTSILDAVCFALFGQVPGARGVKTLRSAHAAPQAGPRVELDFSLDGRCFVVRRSPEWSRPKRRGDGFTVEPAAASLIEVVDDTEHLLSSRAQEVGHLLSDLLGMTAAQFQQVAMLPQGEFQTFLRATSQERHDVLQQLFGTERFTRIEAWMADHSRRLRDEAAEGETAVRRHVDTIAHRAGIATPEHLDGEALVAAAGAVLPWARELVAGGEADLRSAAAAHESATQGAQIARDAHAQAVAQHTACARRDEATRLIGSLHDVDLETERARLDADRRATQCRGVLQLLDDAAARRADAALALEAAALPVVVDPAEALLRASDRLAQLQALLPRERELTEARARSVQATTALESLAPRLRDLAAATDALPQRRSALTTLAAEQGRVASGRSVAEQALRLAETQARAAAEVPTATLALESLRENARAARDRAADAREQLLDLVARRLAGMAGELAERLVDGEPCPVCGGEEHPTPAIRSDGAIDEAAQATATAEAEARREEHQAALTLVQQAELRLATVTYASGGLTPDAARVAVEQSRANVAAATAAESALAETTIALESLEAQSAELALELRALDERAAELRSLVATAEATARALHDELTEALEGSSSVATALATQRGHVTALRRLSEAAAHLDSAETELQRLNDTAQRQVTDQGFADPTQARAALLDDATRYALVDRLRRHDTAVDEARRILADPGVAELPGDPPDVEAFRRTLDAAVQAETAAARDHHVSHDRATALRGQLTLLAEALEAWAPARESFVTADSMSRLVRGMGADNRLQIRLSAYVLATRLDQVVAAANERLTHMREQRYLLERTGDAVRKGSQAGLGLRIVDEWTGECRDPATLSGGETFVVSLALALGLSDVVSTESGGVQLGTLFIDEGFGMLDLDTLDDVMDRLDGLRAGGRTVGLVSHVTELRNRITTQLHVDKQRHGSSIAVTTLSA